MLKLSNTLEEERSQRETFDEKKGKETKILDENLHQLLEEEKSVNNDIIDTQSLIFIPVLSFFEEQTSC